MSVMQYRFYFFDLNSYYAIMTQTAHGFIDLHIHSNCSDGAYSPVELVAMAQEQGLNTIAIADHDSVAGVSVGLTAAEKAGIGFIPAIEISVEFNSWHDVHILGYGIDFTDGDLLAKLADFRDRRKSRNIEILERVNDCLRSEKRSTIELDEVLRYAKDTIGRPHIARALLERGYVKSVEDSFQRYLIPCNIPKYYWPIEDAINEIKRLHGIAVLAHPTSITTDRITLCQVIADLKGLGLEGIEVFNNMAQPYEIEFLRRRTAEAGLLATAGSDFHGIEEGLTIGRGRGGIRFSDELLQPLRERLSELQIK
jgi:predicted metal-dependent phosphoesterase TrpH